MPPEAHPRRLEAPALGAPPAPRVPAASRHTLGSGLRVVAAPHPRLPQAVLRLVLPAGAAADPAGSEGLASLTGEMLAEGTAAFSAAALHRELDQLGAALSVSTGQDFTEIELRLLAETMAAGVELLAELLLRPAFPAEGLERVRAETLDTLAARGDEPANLADDLVAPQVFGAEHPYARLTLGSEESVARIARDELHAFHAAHYRPAGSFLVAAGAIDASELLRLLERALGGWQGGAAVVPCPPAPLRAPGAGELLRRPWPDAAQAEIRVAGAGLRRNAPEWVPAAVANYLLGGSTITGRLGANLREEKGWTYGVRSGFSAGREAGAWAVETAVDREVADAALAEILRETELLLRDGPTAEELRRAKDTLILSLPRAFETPGRIVNRLTTVEAFSLGADYWDAFPARVEAVTLDEVMAVARRCFAPSALVRVVVG